MNNRFLQTGYRLTKFAKQTVSFGLTSMLPGRPIVLALAAGAGVAVALVNVQAVADPLPSGAVLGENLSGTLDGQGRSGYMVTGDDRFGGSLSVTIGDQDFQSLVHNFDTSGGAGSGGGAGLGGAFFVDQGATLTIINTDFKSNRVQGGAGGSDPALRFYDTTLNVNGKAVDLSSILMLAELDTGSLSAVAGGGYRIDTLKVSPDVTSMLKEGSLAFFKNYDLTGSIDQVSSSGLVSIDGGVNITPDQITSVNSTLLGNGGVVTNAGSRIEFDYALRRTGTLIVNGFPQLVTLWPSDPRYDDLSNASAALDVSAPSFVEDIEIGDVVIGNLSNIATVEGVEFYTQAEDDAANADGKLVGKVKALTLSDSLSQGLTTFDFIKAPSFDAARFYLTTDGGGDQVINVTSSIADFVEGMLVTYEDQNGNEQTATVTSVDGRAIKLDTPLPAGVSGFAAVENPIVAANTVKISNAGGLFTVGQLVSVPNDSGSVFTGRVQAISGDEVTVTRVSGSGNLEDYYDPSVGLALKVSNTQVVENGSKITVPFDTGSMTSSEIQSLFSGRVFEGSAVLEGISVTGVSVGNGEVTLSLSSSVASDATIDYFKLLSPLSQGGSMNNIQVSDMLPAYRNENVEDGEAGVSATWLDTFMDGGEGVEGTNGAPAGEASYGPGANGGDAGNGSDGHSVDAFLIYDLTAATFGLASATIDITLASLELAGAITPDPSLVPAPDPSEIAAKTAGVVKASFDLTFAITDLAIATLNVTNWALRLEAGLAGLGGDGGDGGDASGGADFFGGGAGGAGGDGGEAGRDANDGGDGGEGGQGGAGGFGAGGGQGGAGGDGGSTGSAAGGNPGDGGWAGFGAGEGANGEGLFGGGGSGLGGAIFVREGGNLLITGDALFELNLVAGGTTSSQFGEAGDAAGSDLFIMKGGNVRLAPGLGNEIRFEGDIADDSLATDNGYMNAAGDGADITISGDGGVVVFNGENTYSGNTIIEGATLDAVLGEGINDASLIRFNGGGVSNVDGNSLSLASVGTLLLGEDYTRRVGTDPGETAWTGSGGFASGIVLGVTVNLGQLDEEAGIGQALVWGDDGFFVNGSSGAGVNGTLTFGSELSAGAVTFTNGVDLNGNIGRVAVYDTGTRSTSTATLSGNWVNGSLAVGDDTANTKYDGLLFLTGTNSLNSLLISSGRTSTYDVSGSFGSLMANAGNLNVKSGATLDTFGGETFGSGTVSQHGQWNSVGAVTVSGAFVNQGNTRLIGSEASAEVIAGQESSLAMWIADSGLDYLADSFSNFTGSLTVGGNFTNDATGSFTQLGDVTVSGSLANAGVFFGRSNLAVAGNLVNTGLMTQDAGDTGSMSVTGNLSNSGRWAQFGAASVGGSLVNAAVIVDGVASPAEMGFAGALSVSVDIDNYGTLSVNDTVTAGGSLSNFSDAVLLQGSDVNVANNVKNDGSWRVATDAQLVISNPAIGGTTDGLFGAGTFILENAQSDATSLTLSQAGDSTFAGVFSGSGSLVKAGVGALTLTNAQTFTGGLDVNSGAVVTAVNDGVAPATAGTFADNLNINVALSGLLDLNVADTIGTLTNYGIVNIDADHSADWVDNKSGLNEGPDGVINLRADLTVGGELRNNGRINVLGDNRTLNIGTLTGSGSIEGNDAGTPRDLTVNQSGVSTYAGSVSGVGDFIKTGSGVLTLTGANVYSGLGRIQGGELVIAAPAAMHSANSYRVYDQAVLKISSVSGVVSGDEVSVDDRGVLNVQSELALNVLDNSGLSVISSALSVSQQINNTTTGRVDSSQSVSAATIVNDGLWNIASSHAIDITENGAGGLTGSGVFCLESIGATAEACDGAAEDPAASATTLTLNQAGTSSFDGTFAGLGSLEKTGVGRLTLTSAQSFAGGLSVQNGRLSTSQSATFNDSLAIVVGVNGTLDLAVVDTIGSLTSSGVVNISAAQTMGFSRVDAGTLNLGANVQTTDLAFAVNAPGTVRVEGDRVINADAGISGDGSIILNDNADLTLDLADGTISTFRGVIKESDENSLSSTLTLVGGGSLAISRTADASDVANHIVVATLDIQNGHLLLDGSELLQDDISVNVDAQGILELVDDADESVVRTESIQKLSGAGLIDINRNTLNIENGGSFEGVVEGTGSLNVADGQFTIQNSMTSTNGTLNVSNAAGTTIASGTTVTTAAVMVQNGATLHVSGTGTHTTQRSVVSTNAMTVASGSTLNMGDGQYDQGDENNSIVDADSIMVNGLVTGNGTLQAPTVMVTSSSATAPANLRPGDSPGVLTFDTDVYTLGDNSTLQIEVLDRNSAAGIGFDQTVLTQGGELVIEGNAVLNIDDIAAHNGLNFNANNYALGSTIRFAVFDELAIKGSFATVNHNSLAGDDKFVVNLATGSLVGVGQNDLADAASNSNQARMLSGLKVSDTEGVDQYYGGKLVEHLTTAWANDANLTDVFEKASPEVYSGLAESATLAASELFPEWNSEMAKSAFFSVKRSNRRADAQGGQNMRYGAANTGTYAGSTIHGENVSAMIGFGAVQSELHGDYLQAEGKGNVLGVNLLTQLGSNQNWTMSTGLKRSAMKFSGSRETNDGNVSFAGVRSSATEFNVGAEYNGSADGSGFAFKANAVVGLAASASFSESPSGSNTLEAMAINEIEHSYSRVDVGMNYSTFVGSNTQLIGSLTSRVAVNEGGFNVGGAYDNGQGAFDVNADGFATDVTLGFGLEHTTENGMSLRFDLGGTSGWDGKAVGNASLSAGIKF